MTADADQAPKRPKPKRKTKKKQQQQPSAKAAASTKKSRGRPSLYSAEIVSEILSRLAGGESLRTICKSDHLPEVATVCRWLGNPEHAEFREQYAIARTSSTEALLEDIIEIADDSSQDVVKDKDGNERVNNEVVQRSRLRIFARQWAMSKLAPKRYGDKLEVTGSMEITGLDDAALNERLLALLGSIGKGPAKGDAS